MTDCIYTGAYIKIEPYGAFTPADIFRCNDCLVLRINPEQHWTYEPDHSITHILTLPERESQFFWPSNRSSWFTAVVPVDALIRTPDARKPDLPRIE